MSDHSFSIVPRLSSYPGKENKANEILEWLVSLDIVEPDISDCVVSSGKGYLISNGAQPITMEPGNLSFEQSADGLEIITERRVFDTGENRLEQLICPRCNLDISGEGWDFLNEWADNKSNNLKCPLCHVSTDIHHFSFMPEWGFSDLGFTFWNWPELKESFIHDFKQKLGCEINLVFTWI